MITFVNIESGKSRFMIRFLIAFFIAARHSKKVLHSISAYANICDRVVIPYIHAGVSELADEADSKSVDGNIVRVQVPPPALKKLLIRGALFLSLYRYLVIFRSSKQSKVAK